MQALATRYCLGVALCTSIALIACGAGSGKSARDRASCPPYTATLTTDSVTEDGHRALLDLDCSGQRDTVEISDTVSGDTVFPRIAVRGRALHGGLRLIFDQLPRLIAVGDLDGDGIRDLVLTVVDESTVFTDVVLLTADGPKEPQRDPSIDWRGLQFVLDEMTPKDCLKSVLPRIDARRPGTAVLLLPYGYARNGSCKRVDVARLGFRKGVLTRLP